MTANHVILHVPHSSRAIPSGCQFLLTAIELEAELDKLTDHDTHSLFNYAGAAKIVFPVSRVVVDPERFLEDPMESVGMGVVYTRTADGKALRAISNTERLVLIDTYYHPHHASLTSLVDDSLKQHGRCLIIDCHSFPAQPLPYETDSNRPDICIGTDTFHTSTELVDGLSEAFKALGYVVAIDSPFRGTIVPLNHYHTDRRVSSIMIEVNRSLYDDPSGFARIQSDLSDLIEQAAAINLSDNTGE
jgi:N-formylglutamate amidohydrolase